MGWTDVDFWALVFLLSEWAIRLVMLAVVPVRRTPTAAKSWLLLMLFEPWIGLVLYLLIEPDGPVFAEQVVRVLAGARHHARGHGHGVCALVHRALG